MRRVRSPQGLFDTYIIVDWSAANTPKQGKDSIWIGEARREKRRLRIIEPINPPTRHEAMTIVLANIARERDAGRRVFAGFDFPFGYPAGAAQLIAGQAAWEALWERLADKIVDDEHNRSNRYALADRWNRDCFPTSLFWGRPHQHEYECLSARKPKDDAFKALELRTVERWQRPAKSVWQLAYNGAVGSQAMLGMAHLQQLRDRLGRGCAVWPFETQWDLRLDAPVAMTEVYPSMVEPVFRKCDVKDAAQVRTLTQIYAENDKAGALQRLLSKPPGLGEDDEAKVLLEEGWIVGAGHMKQ